MALHICYEALVRTALVIMKIAYENWFYTLGFIVFAYLTHKKPWLQGMMGWLANVIADSSVALSFMGPIAFIVSLIAKVAVKAVFSVIVGLVWMMIVLMGQANIILKLFAAPIFFMLGFAWGLFPIPVPASIILPYAFRDKNIANGVCILAIAGFLLFGFFASETLCEAVNWMAMQLQ